MLQDRNYVVSRQEAMDSQHPIPLSGHFITFPLQQEKKVTIKWNVGLSEKSADYIVVHCWWGNVKGHQFSPLGETVLFVAAEYIEDRYSGAKHFSSIGDFHVKDQSRKNMPPDYFEKGGKWALLQLNSKFHYGQDKTKMTRFRWLVYHPNPLSPTLAQYRNIYQHRFVGSPAKSFMTTVANAATNSGNQYLSIAGNVGHTAVKLMSGVVGHRLHNFLDISTDCDPERARASEYREEYKDPAHSKQDGVAQHLLLCAELESSKEEVKQLLDVSYQHFESANIVLAGIEPTLVSEEPPMQTTSNSVGYHGPAGKFLETPKKGQPPKTNGQWANIKKFLGFKSDYNKSNPKAQEKLGQLIKEADENDDVLVLNTDSSAFD